ncbi:hypothetical protein [Glutamicibacter sp.]|uniref:hypothetical protein n=1 Tax=Glutamicibacter sp. TaxID=1931995 RepID=UPI0028BDB71A|nr:hypothetical protein [Glutamicibacter sp.]
MEFVKLNPTSNSTVLVTSRHPVQHYQTIAEQLLRVEHLHAEQIGFVLPPESDQAHLRLIMAGGEYCVNACMALAALHASARSNVASLDLVLEASGTNEPTSCRVEPTAMGFRCRMGIASPLQIEPYPFPTQHGGSSLVKFHDSVHLVVEAPAITQTLRRHALATAQRLAASEAASVIGVMLYNPTENAIVPLVNVPAVGSMIWEGSCGSGTAALGAFLAARCRQSVSLSVRQPGGSLHVAASYRAGAVTDLQVTGEVTIVAEGKAYVHV